MSLQVAADSGDLETVKLLLDHGADANIQAGEHGTALQAAAHQGYQDIIKLLLDHGADANIQGGNYGTALQAAAFSGDQAIVKLLLDSGADINSQGGYYGNALQAAAYKGHQEIVKLLLDQGAEINIQGGHYGTALQAAAYQEHQDIVELLLDHGADVNIQGGNYGTALQAASFSGDPAIMKLLLDRGAEINIQGGHYGTALQAAAASFIGHQEIVKLLLDQGAEINSQGGYYGTALQAAAYKGYEEIVKLLLDQGAEINSQGGYYGTALQASAFSGDQAIVKLLLDHGADINIQGGNYGTALQAASFSGDQTIVKLLLDRRAEINSQGGYYGNALQAAAASFIGHQEIVKLLLDRGAEINSRGGYYGTALQAAAYEGYQEIVKLLLDQGAEINIQGGHYGTALQAAAASFIGHKEIVKLLLDRGAEINSRGGYYGTALQAAAYEGYQEIVKLLLDQGADINIQGGKHGNALQAAVIGQKHQTAKLLLNRGADVQYSVAGAFDVPLLHAPVESRNQTLLELLLVPAAAALVNAPDFLGRTPIHLAATNGDIGMLQTLWNFSPDLIDLNCQDIDGFTPLHCAVKNHTSEAVKWLIKQGAMVEAKDFTMTTPLQLASQLRNFGIFCRLLSEVTEVKMSASELREYFSRFRRKQILLYRNMRDENSIQAMDYQEVVRYFDALSYQLGLSTSDVEERYAECITTLPVQQSIVIFDRKAIPGKNSVVENSPVGVYYFWWRKTKRKERDWPNNSDILIWKIQSRSMPSPAAVRQPHQTECFLECHMVLPVYLPNDITSSENTSFAIPSSKHVITWIMVKNAKDKTEPQEQQSLRPKIFLSTLEYAEIPRSELELLNYCLQQLEQEWSSICRAAEDHLAQMHEETLDKSGQNPKIIKQHLSDARTWASLEATRSQQAMILQELCKTYNTSAWPYLQDSWSDQDRFKFQKDIEGTYDRIRMQIAQLKQKSRELIYLEFSLTSIAEAQKSTSMNRSMKRLSWITFVFLPLMFVATIFGMNVDLLESNPAWWLYMFFALGTAAVTISVWILFKRNPKLDSVESHFQWLLRKQKLRDEELGIAERRRRTRQFPGSGKKRS